MKREKKFESVKMLPYRINILHISIFIPICKKNPNMNTKNDMLKEWVSSCHFVKYMPVCSVWKNIVPPWSSYNSDTSKLTDSTSRKHFYVQELYLL